MRPGSASVRNTEDKVYSSTPTLLRAKRKERPEQLGETKEEVGGNSNSSRDEAERDCARV